MRKLATATASAVFTIPSLALFVMLPVIIPTRVRDEANVIVALTLYQRAMAAPCNPIPSYFSWTGDGLSPSRPTWTPRFWASAMTGSFS